MTLLFINNKRKLFKSNGFTLVEVLAVVVIISMLVTAATVPFVYALDSYKGQYETESRQLQAQRSISEFTSYGSRSSYYTLSSASGNHTLKFTDSNGTWVSFLFVPIETLSDGTVRGNLSINFAMQSYLYDVAIIVPPAGPFQSTQGGVAFYFKIESAGAPISFQTFVHLSPI